MRSVESEGSTIDDAIARALTALGVTRDEAEVEIIENAIPGFLGIGRKKARVRVAVRRPLRAWMDLTADEGRTSEAVELASRSAARPETHGSTFEPAPVLREILRHLAIDATVGSPDAEGVLQLEGPGIGEFVGQHGEVLDALEYLLNRMAERAGGSARFVVDGGDYRAKRRSSLEELAHRLAERARQRGKPITLDPLNPEDRRVVYQALKSEHGVAARSVGQGYYRKVVIVPGGARRGGGKAAS